jgi:chemotaxis protein methyltransferase CheR
MSGALQRAEAVVEEHVGLRPSPATELRMASSIQRRATARGLELDAYVERLSAEPAERQALLDLVTVQETSFFRDGGQIEAVVRRVIPAASAPIVLWSAGCATGQEPYSLAMALDEAGVRDWWIVASDLSADACARTRRAWYREHELRGLSHARAGRYLRRVDGGWEIVPELRERVTVVHQNIATDLPPVGRGACTAVFCRNVFIYLSRDRVRACLDRIHERLRPDGALFVGGSETLAHDPRFTAVRMGDVFAYTRSRPDAAATVAADDRRVPDAASVRRSRAQHPAGRRLALVTESAPVAPPLPSGAELRRAGEAAARRGAHAEAASAFRRAAYVDPDDVAAHLGLGFSLEALGHPDAGRRAFAAAQVALERADSEDLAIALEGYGAEAVRVVLAAKLGSPGGGS